LAGLDKEQFQQFRYALFPASGFQSFQYRLIELYLTDLKNLVYVRSREELVEGVDAAFMYKRLYWKKGMINPRTGDKSPTLVDFEQRYDQLLFQHSLACQDHNIWRVFDRHYKVDGMASDLIAAMRELDELFNIRWAGLHYQVAMKHLTKDNNTTVKSTGSTHWRKYLHPKFQRIIFFPKLWNEQELMNWGNL
ncbi:MAG: tryptophan 2,3-dioxygenase, partial [Bacteroidota bacterium]